MMVIELTINYLMKKMSDDFFGNMRPTQFNSPDEIPDDED